MMSLETAPVHLCSCDCCSQTGLLALPSVIQPADRALVHSIVSCLAFFIYKCIYSCVKSMTPPHICLEQTFIYCPYYKDHIAISCVPTHSLNGFL